MSRITVRWTEIHSQTADEKDVFEALVNLYNKYNTDFNEEAVIEGLKNDLENYLEEFLTELSPFISIEDDIRDETITELLENKEFMDKFKEWLNE